MRADEGTTDGAPGRRGSGSGVANALLEVVDLHKHFPVHRGLWQRREGAVRAVDGVSFELARGETLGLVGESGCGKTTVARTVLRLTTPTSGRVVFDGVDLGEASATELRMLRPRMQMVFQDAYASLDPRMSVGRSIGEALIEHTSAPAAERRDRVAELMTLVGLDPRLADRTPHEFSGGQRQRVGIARALALQPDLIVCDEPISALDVSIQAQIVNLLRQIQEQFTLTYLFISHDLGMVKHLCDRVAVMYLGKIVEAAPADALFGAPKHPYTKALFSSVPTMRGHARAPGSERIVLSGETPSPADPPSGCRFHTRCPYAEARCRAEEPELRTIEAGSRVACHLV